jgi:hypothetical protein
MRFKNSGHTSKKTPHFNCTEISWLMLFKEIITLKPEACKTNKYKM